MFVTLLYPSPTLPPPPPPPEWSHAFSEGVDLLMHQSATLLTYHDKQALLRSWDTDTGHLEWEIVLERTSRGGRWEGEGVGGGRERGQIVVYCFQLKLISLLLYFHPLCAVTCFTLTSNVFQTTVCSNVQYAYAHTYCTHSLHTSQFKSSSVN